jgi:photosystem II stability/assembly factor-like uncharacterized protein
MCPTVWVLRLWASFFLRRVLPALGLSAVMSLANAGTAFTDFNGDQNSDILWRGPNGEVAIWLMQFDTIESAVVVATIPLTWTIAGVGDFDGDGDSDILWRGPKGEVAIWLMHGTTIKSAVVLGTVPLTWTIAGVGDFNGDGKADILWRGPNNVVAFWLMNGTSIASAPVLPFGMNSYWTVGAVGDFKGDGTSDLIWLGGNGEVALWQMQNATIAQSAVIATVPAGQRIVGVGRITAGVGADILWTDIYGRPTLWQLNGLAPPTSTFVYLPVATDTIAAVAQYFGGNGAILIRDQTGTPSFLIYDNAYAQFNNQTFSNNVPTSWVVYSPHSGLTTVQPPAGGATWQALESIPTTSTLNDLQILPDNQTGFAVGNLNAGGPVFLKTVNAGSTWTPINTTGKTTSGINAVQFLDNLNGFVVGSGEETASPLSTAFGTYRALRTADGGASWTDFGNLISTWEYDQTYYDVHFTDSMHGWVIGSAEPGETASTPVGQRIYATTDGGMTWKMQSSPQAGINALRAGDSLHLLGFAPNTVDEYVRTEDGGATWTAMRVPMQAGASSDSISDFQFVDALNVFAVGHTVSNAYASVWYSADAGKTWVQRSSPSNILSQVYFSSATNGNAVDNNGGFYRTADGGVTWTTLIAPNVSLFAQVPALVSVGSTAFWSLVQLPSQSTSGNVTVIEKTAVAH